MPSDVPGRGDTFDISVFLQNINLPSMKFITNLVAFILIVYYIPVSFIFK